MANNSKTIITEKKLKVIEIDCADDGEEEGVPSYEVYHNKKSKKDLKNQKRSMP